MSNFDSNSKKGSPQASLKNIKWKTIQTDLKSAMNDWSVLDTKEVPKSHEEEQLDKVKSIIENIKEKLNQF